MSNLVARHSLKNLRGLMERVNRPFDAPSFSRVLRAANHSSPDVKTVQLIVYRHKPVKSAMAESIIDAFSRVAQQNILYRDYVFEYDCLIPDLSDRLNRAAFSSNDPENEPIAALATHVNCNESVLRAMMIGSERLVPYGFAERIAAGAMMICNLAAPLSIERCAANERSFKPLGADTGRPPDKCEKSAALRESMVGWFEGQC